MKRLIANPEWAARGRGTAFVVVCASVILAACSPDDRPAPRPADVEQSAWMVPPRFDGVDFSGDGVVVSGQAEPNRRVVLTDQTGRAAAASADAQGAVTVRLPGRPGLSLWRIDMATGAEEARTGQWLAVSTTDRTAVVLRAGASARPVGPAGLLATADYDGGGLLVAGRASPGQQVQVVLDEGPVRTAVADENGWYEARFPAVAPGARRLRAQSGATLHEVPLVLAAPSGALDFAREPGGLRIDWSPPGGGGQSTWIVRGAPESDAPAAS